jgi:hypothetical protein
MLSRNAQIARKGNHAESLLCSQESVRQWLTTYFGKPVRSIEKIPGHKKSDNRVLFEDNSSVRIQNKDGTGNGRGWSIDRRDVDKVTSNTELHTLLRSICVARGKGTDRPTVPKQPNLLQLVLLGSEPEFAPEYVTHTTLNASGTDVASLDICPIDRFLEGFEKEMHTTMVVKRTCVHASPSLYFQRKGGQKGEGKPDQIQTKMHKLSPAVMELFTTFKI